MPRNQAPNQAFRLVKGAGQPIGGGQPDWRGANNGHEAANRPAISCFFSSLLRVLFTFVLPVAFLTTVPAEALLGEGSWHWALGSLLMAALFLIGTRLFWLFALRLCTSASS
jgi:ABC-type uncharacterized transport system permease subunit